MGLCTSADCVSSDSKSRRSSKSKSINIVPSRRIVGEEHKQEQGTHIEKTLPLENGRAMPSNWSCSFVTESEPAIYDNKLATDSITSDSSFSLQSNSSMFRKLMSYDGLNKRAKNRCDIGIEILKAQIHYGANPNMRTLGDRTCLMFSVIANDFSFMKKLVEMGVDVNETNNEGETALALSIELQHHNLTKYLRSKGATDKVL